MTLEQYLLLGNGATAIMAIFFFVFLFFNQSFGRKIIHNFVLFSLCFVILAVVDSLDLFAKLEGGAAEWAINMRYWTNSVGFLLRVISLIFLGLIFQPGVKKLTLYYLIPIGIEAIILIVNFFYPWSFSFDAQGAYVSHFMEIFVYLIDAYCLILTIIMAIRHARSSSTHLELVIIILMGVSIAAATVLEAVFGIALVFNAAAFACGIFYYIFLQVNAIRLDDLTKLYNRKTWDQHLEDNYLTDGAFRKECVMVCCDMNGLKTINDTQGHAAGDKGIASFADAYRAFQISKTFCYRVGGDEFVVMSQRDQSEVLAMMRNIDVKYQQMGYSISFGVKVCAEGEPFKKCYKEADEAMYQMKSAYYQKIGKKKA